MRHGRRPRACSCGRRSRRRRSPARCSAPRRRWRPCRRSSTGRRAGVTYHSADAVGDASIRSGTRDRRLLPVRHDQQVRRAVARRRAAGGHARPCRSRSRITGLAAGDHLPLPDRRDERVGHRARRRPHADDARRSRSRWRSRPRRTRSRTAAPCTIEGTLSGTGSAERAGAAAGEAVPVHRRLRGHRQPGADARQRHLRLQRPRRRAEHPVPRRRRQRRVRGGRRRRSCARRDAATRSGTGTHRHPAIRFSGTITPAEPSVADRLRAPDRHELEGRRRHDRDGDTGQRASCASPTTVHVAQRRLLPRARAARSRAPTSRATARCAGADP